MLVDRNSSHAGVRSAIRERVGGRARGYIRSLEARKIPSLLVGGKSFHAREEVETMRAALSAIEWPDDELPPAGRGTSAEQTAPGRPALIRLPVQIPAPPQVRQYFCHGRREFWPGVRAVSTGSAIGSGSI